MTNGDMLGGLSKVVVWSPLLTENQRNLRTRKNGFFGLTVLSAFCTGRSGDVSGKAWRADRPPRRAVGLAVPRKTLRRTRFGTGAAFAHFASKKRAVTNITTVRVQRQRSALCKGVLCKEALQKKCALQRRVLCKEACSAKKCALQRRVLCKEACSAKKCALQRRVLCLTEADSCISLLVCLHKQKIFDFAPEADSPKLTHQS